MKKAIKKLIKAKIIILAATALANHLIFYFAKRRRMFDNKFKWRHGDINYQRVGEGEPLLLLHGVYPGASRMEWQRCIKILSKRYQVYSVDLLGFGESDKPDLTYSAYLYVTLINDFIKKVIKRKTSVAASGESAAFAVMAQAFEPENFDRMILISPSGLADDYPGHINVWQRWLLESPIIGTAIYNIMSSKICLKHMLKDFGYSDVKTQGGIAFSDILTEHYLSSHSAIGAKTPLSAYLSKHLSVNICDKLNKTGVPIRIIQTSDDDYRYEADNPHVSHTLLKTAGIMPHISDSKAFCGICNDFIYNA